jgi:hypothetical protein
MPTPLHFRNHTAVADIAKLQERTTAEVIQEIDAKKAERSARLADVRYWHLADIRLALAMSAFGVRADINIRKWLAPFTKLV